MVRVRCEANRKVVVTNLVEPIRDSKCKFQVLATPASCPNRHFDVKYQSYRSNGLIGLRVCKRF